MNDHLSHEIHEQPEVLARLLDELAGAAAQVAAAVRTRDVLVLGISQKVTETR
jgi:hypothetical protein